MRNNRSIIGNYGFIWFTLATSFILQVMPFSSVFYLLQPHWVMLILVYWIIVIPHRIGITTAFILGFLCDLLSGAVLGVHAFLFSIIAYLIAFRCQLIKNLALWQQSLVIFGLSIIYILFEFLFDVLIYQVIVFSPIVFFSAFLDALLWVGVFLSLQRINRYFVVI